MKTIKVQISIADEAANAARSQLRAAQAYLDVGNLDAVQQRLVLASRSFETARQQTRAAAERVAAVRAATPARAQKPRRIDDVLDTVLAEQEAQVALSRERQVR